MENNAETLLRTQFKMEMLVYTQDRTYSSSLNESKKEEQERSQKQLLTNGFISQSLNNHATLVELMLHLKSYYRVCFDHGTTQMFWAFFLTKCSFLFQIASQRLGDQIPLVIRYHMLQEFAVQLQRDMLQVLQDKENIEMLLKEDCDIENKRVHLQSRLRRLTQARAFLLNF